MLYSRREPMSYSRRGEVCFTQDESQCLTPDKGKCVILQTDGDVSLQKKGNNYFSLPAMGNMLHSQKVVRFLNSDEGQCFYFLSRHSIELFKNRERKNCWVLLLLFCLSVA